MFRLTRSFLPLVLSLGIVGCTASRPVEPTEITLHISAEAPSEPVEEQVKLNSVVTLDVSSEVDGVLHVHGYEEELDLTAGSSTERTFTASMVGAYEVETHDPDAVWIKLVVS